MHKYRCVKCDVEVTDEDREAHAQSSEHQAKGGHASQTDEDYEVLPPDEPGTRGTSWTR